MRFLDWWENRLTASLGFLVFTHLAQIPHMIWNADMYLQLGNISRMNPVLDFFLYGVDLLEIPAIIAVTMSFLAKLRHKYYHAKL
ncbi:MAG: hypothetical protein ACKO7N_05715 [Candidatus Nitrosotenuis sp.]